MIGKSLMKHHCLKKKIYSNLNIKDIADEDYIHAERVFKGLEIKTFGEIT